MSRHQFSKNGFEIYRCVECGAEFLAPQPTDAVLADLYSSAYFIGSGDDDSFRRVAELKRATAELYVRAIRPFVRAKQPLVLEVGCGSGDFLLAAKESGFQVEGLEYSAHAARVANQRLGLEAVSVGSLDGAKLADARYDLVAGFDVIEHVRDPWAVLEQLGRAVKPGGVIALATPSLDSWSRRLLGKYWMEYKVEHLTYFGKQSLRKAFNRAGMTDVRFLSNWKILSPDYIAEHFERYPVPMITPFTRMIRAILPKPLARSHVKVVASGIMVITRKPG